MISVGTVGQCDILLDRGECLIHTSSGRLEDTKGGDEPHECINPGGLCSTGLVLSISFWFSVSLKVMIFGVTLTVP